MSLKGPQQEQLVNAFLDAFPDYADLKYMVSTKLSENLAGIAGEGKLRNCIFELIIHMDSKGRIRELILGALDGNKNEKLIQCAIDLGIITSPYTLDLPSLVHFDEITSLPRDILFSHEPFTVSVLPAPFYREEMYISLLDARRYGIRERSTAAILSIQPLTLDKATQNTAVRLLIDETVPADTIRVNQPFAESIGLSAHDRRPWYVRLSGSIVPVKEIVFELRVERGKVADEIKDLRRQRFDLFFQRCLLVEHTASLHDLSLPISGRGSFNIYALQPELSTVKADTLLLLDEHTTIQLLVPHGKSGVDMVILVDASGSMDVKDYVGPDHRPHKRLDGVLAALETLIQRRLVVGSRISRLAIVVFAGNAVMLYPGHFAMEEMNKLEKLPEIRQQLKRRLNPSGLRQLKVDRGHTNISEALSYAASLLDYCFLEGNEKILVLLSDGADWVESADDTRYDEMVTTTKDPAVMADNLYYNSNIRIHTVAISDEHAYRLYIDPDYGKPSSNVPNNAPNVPLLRKIALLTDGIFFKSPDATVLNALFDEIGRGAIYPLT
jgi:hypothetical protein